MIKKIIYISLIILFTINAYNFADIQNFYFKSDSFATINQKTKTITAADNIFYKTPKATYYADNLLVNYQDLNHLDFEHLNHIEATGNVQVITTNNQDITADKYIYDLKQQVHVLEAKTHKVVYKDQLRTLTASERIEYFINNNVIVARGHPVIVGKNAIKDLNKYYFSSDLMNAQLIAQTPLAHSTEVAFIEAINNVYFSYNGTTITSNYAIYYKQENQVEFNGNVLFKNINGNLKGCSAIYNVTTGMGKIIPCSVEDKLKGSFKTNKSLGTNAKK